MASSCIRSNLWDLSLHWKRFSHHLSPSVFTCLETKILLFYTFVVFPDQPFHHLCEQFTDISLPIFDTVFVFFLHFEWFSPNFYPVSNCFCHYRNFGGSYFIVSCSLQDNLAPIAEVTMLRHFNHCFGFLCIWISPKFDWYFIHSCKFSKTFA